jgi:hypothetical protein
VFDSSIGKTSCVKTKPISTLSIKKIAKDFFDQDQSGSLNQDNKNSNDELTNYLEQKKLERKTETDQLRKEELEP